MPMSCFFHATWFCLLVGPVLEFMRLAQEGKGRGGERGNLLQDVMGHGFIAPAPPHLRFTTPDQYSASIEIARFCSFFLSCFLMRPLSLPARAVPMQHCVMRGVVGSNGEGQVLRKRVVGCEGSAGHVLFAGRVCSGCQTRALRAVCRAFDSSSFLEIAVWMCKMPAIMRKQTVGRESC